MELDDVVIILCRPEEPGNVGAVCRAMMNMGLRELRLVLEGGDPSALDPGPLRARAVHAESVWDQARCYPSLPEAAADCSLVIGTTRRRGRHRKNLSLSAAEAASSLKGRPGRAALVFGCERSGLSREELACCNLASHIPVSDAFPSLNLSHAVQIYSYEIFRALRGDGEIQKGHWVALGQEKIAALVTSICNNLESLGFYKQPGREEQEHFLRDLLSRSGITQQEGDYFSSIFSKAARLALKTRSSTGGRDLKSR